MGQLTKPRESEISGEPARSFKHNTARVAA
jgi:hypothetical protein